MSNNRRRRIPQIVRFFTTLTSPNFEKIPKQDYERYMDDIIRESLRLQENFIHFIVKIYGAFNFIFFLLYYLVYHRINAGIYLGIAESAFSCILYVVIQHKPPATLTRVKCFGLFNIAQFFIITYLQFTLFDDFLGFLPVLFAMLIASMSLITSPVSYAILLAILLSIDILETVFFQTLDKYTLAALCIENLFILYCGIFINTYFSRMKITEIKITAELIRQRDMDSLTQLKNRRAAERYINTFTSNDGLHALFILDIDNFKGVNDTFGHNTGDELLKQLAADLLALFRPEDCVSRLGGDEFLIFMPCVADPNDARKAADRIIRNFPPAVTEGGKTVAVSCSIGIAFSHDDRSRFYEDLYTRADAALYKSKQYGKCRYTVSE